MKLTIELVPASSWYSNVRSNVSKTKWDQLKKITYQKANYRCEICGGKGDRWPVECHEIWSYENKIQKLEGLIALCPSCHEVKHIGLARVKGNETRAIYHLMKVNNISHVDAIQYVEDAFDLWERRSFFKWKLDISYLDNIKLEPKRGWN